MIWLALGAAFIAGAISGYFGLLRQQAYERARIQSRCTWCGAKRSRPRAPVCDACLGIAKPLVKVQQSKDGTPWPAEVDE